MAEAVKIIQAKSSAVFEQLAQFQITMGLSAKESFPVRNLTTTSSHGGVIMVAYIENTIVGLGVLVPGKLNSTAVGWCSHMVIDPEIDIPNCKKKLFRALSNFAEKNSIELIHWGMSPLEMAEIAWQFKNLGNIIVTGLCDLGFNLLPYTRHQDSLLIAMPIKAGEISEANTEIQTRVIGSCSSRNAADVITEFKRCFKGGHTVTNLKNNNGQWQVEIS